MAKEIEHKFLVQDLEFVKNVQSNLKGTRIVQGYLATYSVEKPATVRVRLYGDEAFLTIKGPSAGISRDEFEYSIPVQDAELMMKHCVSTLTKTRYKIYRGPHIWELDVFEGPLQGLVLAELEVSSEDEVFEIPPWCGRDVSTNPVYANSNLGGCIIVP